MPEFIIRDSIARVSVVPHQFLKKSKLLFVVFSRPLSEFKLPGIKLFLLNVSEELVPIIPRNIRRKRRIF